jgi:two-component system, OmpR family, phosphate regulon response regulator PhoB
VDHLEGPPAPTEASVLMVEDDRGIAGLYRQRLELEGYAVTVAVDGESALSAAFASLPRLVVLDVRLPDLSGLEVLERLRKDRRTRQLPVVILTNWADEAARARSIELGALDFLVKSEVRPGELAERIRDWLGEQNGGQRGRSMPEGTTAAS